MADPNTITALPDAPVRGDAPDVFATKANVFLGALALLATESNQLATWMNTTAAAMDGHATTATDLYNQLNTLLAGLPDAMVDDAVASAVNTYSSNKIVALLADKLDATAKAVSAATADKLKNARTITINGDVTSVSQSFDGSAAITFTVSVKNNSHTHTLENVDGLSTSLNGKAGKVSKYSLDPNDAVTRSGTVITLHKGDGTSETIDIAPMIASQSAGGPGTYAMLRRSTSSGAFNPGSNYSGLVYSNGNNDVGGSAAGTWKAMGYSTYDDRSTLFKRV